jgi:hypothetical protein
LPGHRPLAIFGVWSGVRTAGEAARHYRAVHSDPSDKTPVGPQWIHEIKHDGYRLIARKRGAGVRLFTRNGFDWTTRYPRISEAVAAPAGNKHHQGVAGLQQDG